MRGGACQQHWMLEYNLKLRVKPFKMSDMIKLSFDNHHIPNNNYIRWVSQLWMHWTIWNDSDTISVK